MSSPSSLRSVIVTGASGFLGSHVTAQLLARGDVKVYGTVRDTSRPDKVAHLEQLPGAAERLELVTADLLDASSVASAIVESQPDTVFHVASPFFNEKPTDPEKELLAPAREGTLSVLRAARDAGSVKRVVLTASTASVMCAPAKPAGHVWSGADWSDEKFCEEKELW